MTYRLLHLADLHLDRTFAALGCVPDVARRRRQGLRDALQAAGRLALERGCDAVTIGGDLYEHERAGVDTEHFLIETFRSWRPMRVFLAPGNHDALLPGSLYRRACWPENVHIFSGSRLEPAHLDDGLTLWGLAHREPAWQGNPLGGDSAPAGGVHLALFHGAELGSRPEGKAVHGPFVAEEIRARGFAAALSGHYHKRRIDNASGLLYPGSPEPLTFDETGERGPVMVSVQPDGDVAMEPVTLNRWTAHCVSCDIGEAGSSSSALDLLESAVARSLGGEDPERALVRVDCCGEVDPAISLDAATVEHAIRDRLGVAFVAVRDLSEATVDLAGIAEEHSARGAFVRAARSELEAADLAQSEVLRDAIRYGLAALAGAEVGLR